MSGDSSRNEGFFDEVRGYFLERTGRGLVLSSRDLELLVQWRRSGASAAQICRGIDTALDTLKAPPKDLYACRRYIEPDLQPQQPRTPARVPGRQVAQPVAPLSSDNSLVDRLGRAASTCSDDQLRRVYSRFRERVGAMTRSMELSTAADLEAELFSAVYQALPPDERAGIDADLESRYKRVLSSMSEAARKETIRAKREELLAERYGVPRFDL